MEWDVTIIGAGVVGLALAAELSESGASVLVVERHGTFGRETSSRSSEVIHAGLYYPPGSLKALTCVEGRRLLVAACRREGLAHRVLGKLVVATQPRDEERLEALLLRGLANGVEGLRLLDASDVRRREPRVRASAALWSPSSGVVSSHELMAWLERRSRAAGADIAYGTTLLALEPRAGGWRLGTRGPDGACCDHSSACVVNAAGLRADEVAALAGVDVDASDYRQEWWQGDYFSLTPRAASGLSHLLYPLPPEDGAGLGVHVTLDVAGRGRLGPDAFRIERSDRPPSVEESKARAFLRAATSYLPDLTLEDLAPEQAGVRPKLAGRGDGARDFVLAHEADRGLAGLVNLIGIESPGLTSALSLARLAVRLMRREGLPLGRAAAHRTSTRNGDRA